VHARTSHNELITKVLGYRPSEDLEYGLTQTYNWISDQIKNVK
jgi:nucleoside-diphosphate-sugar epimerase